MRKLRISGLKKKKPGDAAFPPADWPSSSSEEYDLEKSVEEIQKESTVNHKLVTVQELEEKSTLLRKLGETLTELKNQFPGLQSKMRVVLRVEVEAVKFLKEEPHRLDALLKRCKAVTDALATIRKYEPALTRRQLFKDAECRIPKNFSIIF
ncbi:SRC kinase signaling inhibitor 1 [Liparis tanakae]|uniref:SRC kinase signaling inhibitor 1 n=1 Tax=Liparis tanakae TaxID=230148 RepID=A0A4Z2FAP6_9TELE|nr:SRC kinase signaling inhibitor 1 [Liparis tanakae]